MCDLNEQNPHNNARTLNTQVRAQPVAVTMCFIIHVHWLKRGDLNLNQAAVQVDVVFIFLLLLYVIFCVPAQMLPVNVYV